MVGRFGEAHVDFEELHRFSNNPRLHDGHERWNVGELFDGLTTGLAKISNGGRDVISIGVDTWGVDYGLLDGRKRLIEDPICYRDNRTDGIVEHVHQLISRDELFRITGLQTLPLNTIYQLVAQREAREWPPTAAHLLMMPDIVHHYLCGELVGEHTMASTTQLASATTREWAPEVFECLGLPFEVMPPLMKPGSAIGKLRSHLQRTLGLPPIGVVVPATHDTASAVVGAPLQNDWAYISSGTWSLVGVETREPLLTEAVARENLTNEGGFDGTNRLLKNIMGLWILESCRRVWADNGTLIGYQTLAEELRAAPARRAFIVPDMSRFFNPSNMPEEVRGFLRDSGQEVPDDPAWLARVILESLALRYGSIVRRIERVTGRAIGGIQIIGGGAQNSFLNEATADATNRVVQAGPVEATAFGNLMVQAIADGRFTDVTEAREFLARHVPVIHSEPSEQMEWAEARERYAQLETEFGF